MSLLVLVPSRGRPESIRRLMHVWNQTTTQPDTSLIVCVDSDDETLISYIEVGKECDVRIRVGPPSRIGPLLNQAALAFAPVYDAIGFMGDDHRPRTIGWDKTVGEALALLGEGVVYGDDLIQHEALPTAVFISATLVTRLGYFVPPGLQHLFFDNAWKDLGIKLGKLCYLPNVVIEHLHPIAGKAEWDAGYAANNSQATWSADEAVYRAWVKRDLPLIR